MKKRGQVTVFIILGIFILASIAVGYIVSKQFRVKALETVQQGEVNFEQAAGMVQEYVTTCLKRTTEQGLIYLGEQGGYFSLPEPSTRQALVNVPYYLFEDTLIVPTQDQIGQQMSSYVWYNLGNCLDFSVFKNINITARQMQPTVILTDSTASVNLYFPIILTTAGKEAAMDTFSVTVPTRLGLLQRLASNITSSYKDEGSLCLTCMGLLSFEHTTEINVISENESTTFVAIFDYEHQIHDEPQSLRFALQ